MEDETVVVDALEDAKLEMGKAAVKLLGDDSTFLTAHCEEVTMGDGAAVTLVETTSTEVGFATPCVVLGLAMVVVAVGDFSLGTTCLVVVNLLAVTSEERCLTTPCVVPGLAMAVVGEFSFGLSCAVVVIALVVEA